MTQTPTLALDRYVLTHAQLAGAMATAGLTPAESSGLPPLGEGDQPSLEQAELVQDGALHEGLQAALEIVSAPDQLLAVVRNRAGTVDLQEVQLVTQQGRPEVVFQAVTEDEVDLALLPDPVTALALLDDELSLTGMAGISRGQIELDLRSLVALLAASDALLEAKLRAQLDRRPAALPVLTVEHLTEVLDRGLSNLDTRWAVSACQMGSPVGLAKARNGVAGGLEPLLETGMFVQADGGLQPTDDGLAALTTLQRVLYTLSIDQVEADGQGGVAIARFTVLRAPDAIWLITWDQPQGAATRLLLQEVSEVRLLDLFYGILVGQGPATRASPPPSSSEPASPPPTGARSCHACGQAVPAPGRFCPSCGAEQEGAT